MKCQARLWGVEHKAGQPAPCPNEEYAYGFCWDHLEPVDRIRYAREQRRKPKEEA